MSLPPLFARFHRLRCLPRFGLGAITTFGSNELCVSQSFSDNTLECLNESASVIVFALVEAKRLLIQVSKQMKRLDVNVGTLQGAFEQTPEIFQAVCVDACPSA
jgi:hypothetical protein